MEDVFGLSLPVDLLLVDASPKQDAGTTFAPPGDCAAINSSAPCDECRRRRVKDPPLDALGRWARARTRCAGVVALDDLSERHWRGLHPRASISSNPPEGPGSEESTHPGAGAERAALGVLLPIETPATLRLLLALADGVSRVACDVFVFGRTSLDDRLIARGLFVVGPVASVETARVAAQYRISRYLLPYRLENYSGARKLSATAPAPAAYFDWSFGAGRVIPPRSRPRSADLRRQGGARGLRVAAQEEHRRPVVIEGQARSPPRGLGGADSIARARGSAPAAKR